MGGKCPPEAAQEVSGTRPFQGTRALAPAAIPSRSQQRRRPPATEPISTAAEPAKHRGTTPEGQPRAPQAKLRSGAHRFARALKQQLSALESATQTVARGEMAGA